MNLIKRMGIMLMATVICLALSPTAFAADGEAGSESSFLDDAQALGADFYQYVKNKAPEWWQSAKDTASDAANTVKENGPGWVEAARDKGSELLDQGADALQNAGDQVSGFLEGQQDRFWERTEQQISGSRPDATGSGSGAGSETAGSGSEPAEPETTAPAGNVEPTAPTTGSPPASEAPAISETPETPPASEPPMVSEDPGYDVSDDGRTIIIDGKRYEAVEEDEPKSLWAKFWDYTVRDFKLRLGMTIDFWWVLPAMVLVYALFRWLKDRRG